MMNSSSELLRKQFYQGGRPELQLDSDSLPSRSSESSPRLDNMFNHMTLVSPAFTPVSGAMSTEDLTATALPDDSLKRKDLDELPTVFCESRARIPTTNGAEIFLHLYKNDHDDKEHLAIVFGQHIHSRTLFAPREGETEQDRMTRGAYYGKLYPGRERSDMDEQDPEAKASTGTMKDVLVRIHSECYTGETAWSARCDCGEQLDEAARLMAEEGSGVIVYLRQEGRGIGLGEKLKAYNLQDLGADTVTANLMLRHPADARSFGLATAILKDLGLDHIRLLTNNPDKITAVEGKHKEVTVTQRVPMIPLSWQNKGGFRSKEVNTYLRTKVERMGHMLDLSSTLK
ncbi:GTP cyclohydrolase-2 [Trichomonascus vanleenenianus]|uniref:GTP cyclohydrolase II n=1 Tax=Trichomonascus vanleenenianus TaxID=2268995 RepID=UPI003ECB8ED0